ncbi:MarR family winged helix-turn-helix transcriptional regulator [Sphingobacterium prati]|jgi:DNA-binding MarR family transcriptional regulator|uniref:MarR family winged helix-turn-helix transcriptional regulator n=1 Tax=Sphingobacterium prati TaxID=2737006 RepID=UPI00155587CD|nr:MarR family transcriptional regulator [Sphingobacterium prati]MDF2479125.1 MarR family transcriptional regulator [Sphingobacterium sp.]NPE46907.1 MarR family transcriptional regulator [Sphingobacterium prati]
MNKSETDFYQVFTDLQCFILANMNRGNIHGVTATHYNIMEYIYRGRQVTGKQIAEAFQISQAAISKQLKFLTENRLIKQQQSTIDRRFFDLTLTDQGRYIIDNSENFRESIAKKASRSLTKDELKTLTLLLHKLMQQIKE